MDYTVIRSRRRTLALEIKGGELIVRAPIHSDDEQISAFVRAHHAWVEKHLALAEKQLEKAAEIPRLTADEMQALKKQAEQVISERVRYYAPKVNVSYGRVTIRCQKTRWGSCSSRHNLNFNCLLLLAPPEVLDSVVVHELCHIRQMNHSAAFYREVLRVFPEYRKWNSWLKIHGNELMARMPD